MKARDSFKAMVLAAVHEAPVPVNDDTLAGLRMLWCAEGAARDLRELGDEATAEAYEFCAKNMRTLLENACAEFAATKRVL